MTRKEDVAPTAGACTCTMMAASLFSDLSASLATLSASAPPCRRTENIKQRDKQAMKVAYSLEHSSGLECSQYDQCQGWDILVRVSVVETKEGAQHPVKLP